MQQSTYMSLTTQAIKLKLNSSTLKDKLEKFLHAGEEIATSLKEQELHAKQLELHENKTSRDFASLVATTDRTLSDIKRKNDDLTKKLHKSTQATEKLNELKTKLVEKYQAAIIKPEDKNNSLYDFGELKSSVSITEDNYSNIIKNIVLVKEQISFNNSYFDSMQILLSSFNIDKLEKHIISDIANTTKNVEYLSSIYANTNDSNKQEIEEFLPQLELNIYNLNQKADRLFAFGKVKTTNNLSEITKPASNDEQNNSELEHAGLKFG